MSFAALALITLMTAPALAALPDRSGAAAAAPHAIATSHPGATGSSSRRVLYWGATVDMAPPAPGAFRAHRRFGRFERLAGAKMSLVSWGEPWKLRGRYQGFPGVYMETVRRHGAIPVLDWGSWDVGKGLEQPKFRTRRVAAGRYDPFIRKWARRAKEWGHPFMIRFDHEMNGWWFPWGEGKTSDGRIFNGNRPGDYVRAWRHVHRIFERVGARNVTWLWAPNSISTSSRYPSLSSMYPGDRYVDWTGISAYNFGPMWLSPTSILTGLGTDWVLNIYDAVRRLAPNKPMLLAETGSVEASGNPRGKGAWIEDLLLRQLPTRFPQIKGFVWFQGDDASVGSVRIDTSSTSKRAFRRAVSSATYAKNCFGSLSRSPIPPPRACAGTN